MNYFYSTRRDKRGNTLLTSYDTKSSVEKYGGDGKVEHTVYYLNSSTGAINTEGGEGFEVLRSIVLNAKVPKEINPETKQLRFVVKAKTGNEWFELGQSFPQYGLANNFMKSVVDLYEAVAVVDTEPPTGETLRSPPVQDDDDLDITTAGNVPWN